MSLVHSQAPRLGYLAGLVPHRHPWNDEGALRVEMAENHLLVPKRFDLAFAAEEGRSGTRGRLAERAGGCRTPSTPRRRRFVVADSGPGFPPDLLARAFEPFTRGDVETAGPTGAGLGLSIVRAVAEAHGGSATAENSPDGARVTLDVRT